MNAEEVSSDCDNATPHAMNHIMITRDLISPLGHLKELLGSSSTAGLDEGVRMCALEATSVVYVQR